MSLGITQVKHLCEINYHEPQLRILESLKREITTTPLPQHWKDVLHTSSCCGTNAFIKHVTDIDIFSK